MAVLAAAAHSQTFGRFGYKNDWTLPGLRVDKAGFRVNHPDAATLKFYPANPSWSPVETSAMSQTVMLNGRAIKKARANLLGLGFEMYVDGTASFRLSTTQSPFLTWPEGGSVGGNVPTAETKWLIVSFRDSQPPLAIGFIDKPGAMIVKGSAGDWKLETAQPYTGWIRVCAPNGIKPFRTNGAGELGELAWRCKAIAADISAPGPRILETKIEEDTNGVDWSIKLDRTRAVIPPGWFLAPLGGYSVKVAGEPIATNVLTEDGPVMLNSLDTLSVRFPSKRVPLGRYLAIGDIESPAFGTVSALHVPSVVDLALAAHSARADTLLMETARSTLEDFFETSAYVEEPFTKQKLPFNIEGDGAEVTAAHAFLMQCNLNADAADAATNGLLLSLACRRDWMTGRFWTVDADKARRVGALAALAGSFSYDPQRRLDGALFEAGIAGQKGLAIWRKRRELTGDPISILEPMKPLRDVIFGRTAATPYWKCLTSQMRVIGPRGYSLEKQEDGYLLSGVSEDLRAVALRIFSGYAIKLEPMENVTSLEVRDNFGESVLQIRLKQAGPFSIRVTIPEWATIPPTLVNPPTYSE